MANTLRFISSVTELCSVAAVAICVLMSLIVVTDVVTAPKLCDISRDDSTERLQLAWLACMAFTAAPTKLCNSLSISLISWVLSCVRLAKLLTSSATTAKPRPCSPARAASMAALSASKLVCSAMPPITLSTLSIFLDCSLKEFT